MAALFIFSLLIFWYNVRRYSRYKNLVLDTKLKLVDLRRDISHKSIFQSSIAGESKLLIEEIKMIMRALPSMNIYVMSYMYVKHKDIVDQIRGQESALDISSSDFYKNYKLELSEILYTHITEVHYVEIKLHTFFLGCSKIFKFGRKWFETNIYYPFNHIASQRDALIGVKAYRNMQTQVKRVNHDHM